MIAPKLNNDEYRMKSRVNVTNDSIYEMSTTQSAQKLISLDLISSEFLDEFSNFFSLFEKNCTSEQIIQLKSINFDEFLIKILENHKDLSVIQRCLSCIYALVSSQVECDLLFYHQDFALFLSSFALSPELKDQRSYRLSFAILKIICNYNSQCASVLIKSEIIKNLIDFYSNCADEKIQAEIICTLYSLIKSKQVPFEMMTDIAVVFSKLFSTTNNPNLDIILTLASSFAECGSEYCFLLLECLPKDQLFSLFDNFSNDEQASFLRLLISIFDYSDLNDLSTIVDYFKWEIFISISTRSDNALVIQYFATLLSSVFQKSNTLINSAYEADVFQLLLSWIETEKYSIRAASFVALLKAFQFGFNTAGITLLDLGLLQQMIVMLDCNSTVLTKEICKAILILYKYAEENNNKALCENLKPECASEILEAIEYDEGLPCDMMEMLKGSLEDIQSGKFWQ